MVSTHILVCCGAHSIPNITPVEAEENPPTPGAPENDTPCWCEAERSKQSPDFDSMPASRNARALEMMTRELRGVHRKLAAAKTHHRDLQNRPADESTLLESEKQKAVEDIEQINHDYQILKNRLERSPRHPGTPGKESAAGGNHEISVQTPNRTKH